MKNKVYVKILIIIIVILFASIIGIIVFKLNYYYPNGTDFDCHDFNTRKQMLLIYKRAGGPLKDPYELDKDNNGIPCEAYKYSDDIS